MNLMQPTPPNINALLSDASRALSSGNIGHADALLRGMIQLGHPHPEAWNQLALLARMIKEDQTAARFAQFALQMNPHHAQAKNTLAASRNSSPSLDARSSPDNRFLLIRSWNAGFWSDVDHVLGCLLLASLTNRTPVIHWGPDSRYGGTRETSAWNLYFQPVSTHTVHDIAAPERACFPPKWNHSNLSGPSINRFTGPHSRTCWLTLLNRPEPVVVADYFTPLPGVFFYLRPDHPQFNLTPDAVYRQLLTDAARPLAAHTAAAATFAQEHFENRPVLAVHVRGTDKTEEDPAALQLNQHLGSFASQMLNTGRAKSLYLMTDSASMQAHWRTHFGERLITTPSTVIDGAAGLHFAQGLDPVKLGREILIDSLIATHADALAGLGSSNVPRMINYLKSWPPGTVQLAGPNTLALPNFVLFDPRVSFGDRN